MASLNNSGRGRGPGRGRGHGRRRGGFNNRGRNRRPAQKDEGLRLISQETKKLLPRIVELTPQHSADGFLISDPEPPRLDAKSCPGFRDVKIQVIEEDTLDAATMLIQNNTTTNDANPTGETTENTSGTSSLTDEIADRPCILNMASEKNPGGGWLGGARAQEEALCRRSTLILTLSREFYPVPAKSAIYSPSVVIFRKGIRNDGHVLYDLERPDVLPVVSVISMAALRRPELCEVNVVRSNKDGSELSSSVREQRYKFSGDRELMKEKMRIVLRTSVWKGHRRVVLGAFGCGAFGNPKEEVARCWAEVFAEAEFQGGWWRSVVFAVIDETGMGKGGNGNVGVFSRALDGLALNKEMS